MAVYVVLFDVLLAARMVSPTPSVCPQYFDGASSQVTYFLLALDRSDETERRAFENWLAPPSCAVVYLLRRTVMSSSTRPSAERRSSQRRRRPTTCSNSSEARRASRWNIAANEAKRFTPSFGYR